MEIVKSVTRPSDSKSQDDTLEGNAGGQHHLESLSLPNNGGKVDRVEHQGQRRPQLARVLKVGWEVVLNVLSIDKDPQEFFAELFKVGGKPSAIIISSAILLAVFGQAVLCPLLLSPSTPVAVLLASTVFLSSFFLGLCGLCALWSAFNSK